MSNRPKSLMPTCSKGSAHLISRISAIKSLDVAIDLVEDCDGLTDEEKLKITECLYRIITVVQQKVWTKEAVFEFCDNIEKEFGGVSSYNFHTNQAPSTATIRELFGMSLYEFIETYYHRLSITEWKAKYESTDWAKEFKKEFERINPKSEPEFNAKRKDGFPAAKTICKFYKLHRYTDLLKFCGIKNPNDNPNNITTFKITSISHSQEMLDKLNELTG